MVFRLPNNLTAPNTISFLDALETHCLFSDDTTPITIDCATLGSVEPYSMLLLASGINITRKRYPSIPIVGRGPFKSYPSFMGLFHESGLSSFKHDSSYSTGNKRYQQIIGIRRSVISARAEDNFSHPVDEVEIESGKIAQVLAQNNNSDLFEILKYMLTEIMRNWFEHSECKRLLTCAQYWPNLDKVECAILDTGIGMRESLGRNKSLVVPNDTIALTVALQPGTSGKKIKSGKSNDPWANSGYGLYMTSKLCEAGGSFLIMSGERGLSIGERGSIFFKCDMKGTGVRIILKPSRMISLDKALSRFRSEAEKSGKLVIHSASTFSRLMKPNKLK